MKVLVPGMKTPVPVTEDQVRASIRAAVQKMYQEGTVPDGKALVSPQALATYRQVLRRAAISDWHKDHDTCKCVGKLWNLGYRGSGLKW